MLWFLPCPRLSRFDMRPSCPEIRPFPRKSASDTSGRRLERRYFGRSSLDRCNGCSLPSQYPAPDSKMRSEAEARNSESHFKRRAGVARIINIQREVQLVATFSATPPHDLDFAQWWNSSRGNVNPHSGIEVDPDAFPANRNIVDGLQVGHAVKELIWLRLFRDSEPNPGSSKTRGFPKLSSVKGCCRAAAAAELGWEVRLVFSRCRAGRSC